MFCRTRVDQCAQTNPAPRWHQPSGVARWMLNGPSSEYRPRRAGFDGLGEPKSSASCRLGRRYQSRPRAQRERSKACVDRGSILGGSIVDIAPVTACNPVWTSLKAMVGIPLVQPCARVTRRRPRDVTPPLQSWSMRLVRQAIMRGARTSAKTSRWCRTNVKILTVTPLSGRAGCRISATNWPEPNGTQLG